MINDGYYHFCNDLDYYPDAVIYVVWSMRGPGKTYSFLRYCVEQKKKFIYMKRTNEDVNFICSSDKNQLISFDPSPFVPLNRDLGWNIKPQLIEKGVGAFYKCNDMGEPAGAPLGYILSLNKIKSIKGVDFSDCDFICLDEFIPQTHEIVRRSEGAALLDLYMTVARDREFRGRQALKLVLFANSEEISTPITNVLEIVDQMAELNFSERSYMYLEERGIMLHHITLEECPAAQANMKSGIAKVMQNTDWADKALGGKFANNDFSCCMKLPIKNMKPYIQLRYKRKYYYIYLRESDGMYYMTTSKSKDCIFSYDLDREASRKMFYAEHCRELQIETMEDHMYYLKYSMYDLIMHFKEIFKI